MYACLSFKPAGQRVTPLAQASNSPVDHQSMVHQLHRVIGAERIQDQFAKKVFVEGLAGLGDPLNEK
jgi:hypothetical protein